MSAREDTSPEREHEELEAMYEPPDGNEIAGFDHLLEPANPFVRYEMPSGSVVWYHDERHAYYRDVKRQSKKPDAAWVGVGRLTGVSTVVGPADFRPDALLRWAARTNGIGVAMLASRTLEAEYGTAADFRAELSWLNSAESIWRALQEESLTFEDVRDQAAERGTNVHKHALHELALGRPVPAYGEMTGEEQGYASGVSGFWLDHDPKPEYSEQVVADLDLGVAGRLDLIARLGAYCGDPECPCKALLLGDRFLGDCKTSGFISTKFHAQIGGGYEHCARVSGLGETRAQWILQVDADGGYRVLDCHADPSDFACFVDAYRRSGRISKEAAADRKAREAAT